MGDPFFHIMINNPLFALFLLAANPLVLASIFNLVVLFFCVRHLRSAKKIHSEAKLYRSDAEKILSEASDKEKRVALLIDKIKDAGK